MPSDRFARSGSSAPRSPETYTHSELCLSVPPASPHSSSRIRSVDSTVPACVSSSAEQRPLAERAELDRHTVPHDLQPAEQPVVDAHLRVVPVGAYACRRGRDSSIAEPT